MARERQGKPPFGNKHTARQNLLGVSGFVRAVAFNGKAVEQSEGCEEDIGSH